MWVEYFHLLMHVNNKKIGAIKKIEVIQSINKVTEKQKYEIHQFYCSL